LNEQIPLQQKAAYLTAPGTIEMREIPVPEPKNGEVLVKIGAVGVCGSDLHYYTHGRIGDFIVEYPFILGHECAGTVVAVGPGVTGRKIGDRVALEPGVPCGQCEYCLSGKYNLCPDVVFLATPPYNGCLMNYIAYPANWTFPLPDHISLTEGALVEPLAIGVNACLTGGVRLGDTVVIFGAGCIGLVTLLAAKAAGAANVFVVDLIEKRLDAAKRLGAVTVSAKDNDAAAEIMRITNGKGARVAIDCAGTDATVSGAVRVTKAGGTGVLVGLASDVINGLPLGAVSSKELIITSIFRYRNLYPLTIEAIASGKIDVKGIVSNEYKFDDCPRAYAESVRDIQYIVKSVILFS
jgi:L-iditol 2-dehydrogenase